RWFCAIVSSGSRASTSRCAATPTTYRWRSWSGAGRSRSGSSTAERAPRATAFAVHPRTDRRYPRALTARRPTAMGADKAKIATATRIVRRAAGAAARHVSVDICVLGAGIAGVSAALEAARLGCKVALVDALPALGGQAVNSIIGTFCGLFANGIHGYQLTH